MRWLLALAFMVGPASAQYLKTAGELITPNKIIMAMTQDERETLTRALYHNDSRNGIDDLLRARNHRIRDEINDPTYLPEYLLLKTGHMGFLSGIPTPMKPVMTGDNCGVMGHIAEYLGIEKCRWEQPIPVEFTFAEFARAGQSVSNDRYCRPGNQDDLVDIPTVHKHWLLRCHDWNEKANALVERMGNWPPPPTRMAQATSPLIGGPSSRIGPDAEFLFVTVGPRTARPQGPMPPAQCATLAAQQVAAGNTATCQKVLPN